MNDESTFEREVRALKAIKEMYPRYIFTMDLTFQKNIGGIMIENILDFIINNNEL